MTSQPPQHIIPFPVWSGLSLLVIGILLVASGLLVATVLVSSRNSLAIWPRIKAALAVLVWVVPSLAVVGYIASRSESHFANPHAGGAVVVTQVAQPTVNAPSPAILAEAPSVPDHAEAAAAPATSAQATTVTDDLYEARPRLKVRSISSEEAKWTAPSQYVAENEVAILSSQRFATLAQAESQVTDQALKAVKEHYRSQFPLSGDWEVPVETVDHFGVKDLVGEVIDKDFGNGLTAKMYRTHLRLEYSPRLADALEVSMRGQIVNHRLLILGSLLGLVTLMLGSAAGYFRLDDLTGGTYRRRLKLAATAVIAAGSIVVAQIVS